MAKLYKLWLIRYSSDGYPMGSIPIQSLEGVGSNPTPQLSFKSAGRLLSSLQSYLEAGQSVVVLSWFHKPKFAEGATPSPAIF